MAALLIVALPHLFNAVFCLDFNVTFDPQKTEVNVGGTVNVTATFNVPRNEFMSSVWRANAEPTDVLGVSDITTSEAECDVGSCNVTLRPRGVFIGLGKVFISREVAGTQGQNWSRADTHLRVVVVRQQTWVHHMFNGFVITMVCLTFINMGCALDTTVVKNVLRKPIGPAIGFFCQFVVMPLVSFGVGLLVFADDPVLRLGLFTFGSSPGGGASNMWTVLLGGNLDLSLTMTFISTITALGTIPFWLFTLGKTIVEGTEIVVPFTNIVTSLLSFVLPIGIGLLIQRYFPKMAARSKRLLAPICVILIIAIIIVASIANSYMFRMLTWRMAIGASLTVWAGFAVGTLVSLAFRFPAADVVAVAVETGIQNVGIAFVLLTNSLEHPESDLASVVPIMGSIITPFPLIFVKVCQMLRDLCYRKEKFELRPINPKTECDEKGLDNGAMSKS